MNEERNYETAEDEAVLELLKGIGLTGNALVEAIVTINALGDARYDEGYTDAQGGIGNL